MVPICCVGLFSRVFPLSVSPMVIDESNALPTVFGTPLSDVVFCVTFASLPSGMLEKSKRKIISSI